MSRIGIYFGTDTGRTRLVAKQLARQIGAAAASPVNIGRASVRDLLAWDALILGTPTLGEGELPGQSTGLNQNSWEEFIAELGDADFSGKPIALYGLGDQVKYPHVFVDALALLHDAFASRGARMVGYWPTEGYTFQSSAAVEGDHFLGLALDQINQPLLSEDRIQRWLSQILPQLLAG